MRLVRLPIGLLFVALVVAAAIARHNAGTDPESASTDAPQVLAEEVAAPQLENDEENWLYLSDIAWQTGSTGWVSMADDDLPSLDTAFNGGQISVGGTTYDKGIGVYPLSEIVYALDGQYSAFESDFGLNDPSASQAEDLSAGVVFAVYLDGALAFDSGIMRHGQLPGQVHLDIGDVREIRLVVTAAGLPSARNLANWAGARLLLATVPVDEEQVAEQLAQLRQQVDDRTRQRDEDRNELAASAGAEIESYSSLPQPLPASPGPAIVVADSAHRSIFLANGVLNLRYGFGGDDHALLTVLHVPTGRLILLRADSSVLIEPGTRVNLHHDTMPAGEGSYRLSRVSDPVFGTGQRVDIFLMGKTGPPNITFALTLFDSSPYFTEQVAVTQTAVRASNPVVSYFDSLGPSNLALGGGLRYLTDISRLRAASVQDDGIFRRETFDQGKPVFLASAESGLGLLLASMEESRGENYFSAQVDPGKIIAHLGLATGARAATGTEPVSGPRLYVEVTDTVEPRPAFQRFRDFFARLYPPMPLPDWTRYQWLSWYVYYMNINEDNLRGQIDYIAENLGDLGPWHIIVDAGWYVAEGRPGAEWRNVDSTKFPNGLRSLVDYAHSRNVRVVLYFSAPYLDSRTQADDWLGLRALTDTHRDWLIQLGEDETHQSFIYNLDNPDLRAYLSDVMHDYFVDYDVDGIKIDGLGNAEGAVLSPSERDSFGLVDKVVGPSLDVYRFVNEQAKALKDDVYIESGWLTPLFANPLAHTFRYGDEAGVFSSRYPWPGLTEHIEYAIAQKSLWGQRPNVGALQGDPNNSAVDEQWLQAAIALDAQAALSFDLQSMTLETLSRYRGLLVHYRPFKGDTHYKDKAGVTTFATTRDGVTYLGVLNKSQDRKEVTLELADYGLPSDKPFAFHDVGAELSGLTQGTLVAKLEPRSFRLMVLRGDPGVLWTNSSYSVVSNSAQGLTLVVSGPDSINGEMELSVPGATSIRVDGESLAADGNADASRFEYDAATGILNLHYSLARPRRIEVVFG